jgi:hypothetical protein
MTAYSVSMGHSAPQVETPEAAETGDAETPFEAWTGWLEAARDAIDQADGDPDDLDNLLAVILEHVVGGGPDAIASKEARVEEALREAKDLSSKVTIFLHRQREARKTQRVESAALAQRLDRMADQIGSLTQENASLRTSLSACEENLRQATATLEREIARERALRRLIDARAVRPHNQKIASELAKRHAAKALEVVTKSNKGEAA